MVFNKKAISPVVATALLLVVAVVAVVGFQTWFNTYQSGLNTKVEQQSNTGSSITIERLERLNATHAKIYLKNSATTAVTALSIKAGTSSGCTNITASIPSIGATAVTQITIGNDTVSTCDLTVGSEYEVVVSTSSGVYSGKKLAK